MRKGYSRAAIVVAVAGVLAVGCPHVATAQPARGTVRVGARTQDPAGGPAWAVRSWRPAERRGGDTVVRTDRCAQIGRVTGGGLARTFADGRSIRLGYDDRTTCGSLRGNEDSLVLDIERLVDRPGSLAARPVRTVVGGLAPVGVRALNLNVNGVPRELPIDSSSRAFLAVLDGSVRRSDLVLQFEPGDSEPGTIDFGRGPDYRRLVPGTVKRELMAPNPTGGRQLALVGYSELGSERPRKLVHRCLEPATIVGGEAGVYQPRFGSFLESPSLENSAFFTPTPERSAAWAPALPPAGSIGSCLDGPGRKAAFEAVGAKRFSPSLVVVQGFAPPGTTSLRAQGQGVRAAAPALAPDGAFLVGVRSRLRFGERLRLVARTRGGRRRRYDIALGPRDRKTSWSSWQVRGRGRLLDVRWTGGFEPFSGVRVRARRRVVVTVFEREPPDFSADGTGFASPAIAIEKCVTVRLRKPLGRRAVVDGATGRRRRSRPPGLHRARRCYSERPPHKLSR